MDWMKPKKWSLTALFGSRRRTTTGAKEDARTDHGYARRDSRLSNGDSAATTTALTSALTIITVGYAGFGVHFLGNVAMVYASIRWSILFIVALAAIAARSVLFVVTACVVMQSLCLLSCFLPSTERQHCRSLRCWRSNISTNQWTKTFVVATKSKLL